MRNQTTKSHNAKSKILLITLCIFGLLFSYSCQCKNNVSDPNNIPPDGGLGGGGGGGSQTDTDPDKDLVDGALSTTSTKVIVVAGAGDTVKTTSTIKFKNATAELTKVEDSSVSNSFELADLSYTGTTLTLSDSGRGKAPEGEYRTVKATFSLTASSANVGLTETEKTVDIEIGKMSSSSDKSAVIKVISEDLKNVGSVMISGLSGNLSFFNNTVEGETIKVKEDNKFDAKVSTSSTKTAFESKFNEEKARITKITKMEFDSVEVSQDKKTATFKYKIFLINLYEPIFETTTLSIDITLQNVEWEDDIKNPTPSN